LFIGFRSNYKGRETDNGDSKTYIFQKTEYLEGGIHSYRGSVLGSPNIEESWGRPAKVIIRRRITEKKKKCLQSPGVQERGGLNAETPNNASKGFEVMENVLRYGLLKEGEMGDGVWV